MQLKKRFSVFRRIAASVLLLGCVSCEREAPIPQTAQNTSTATYQTLDKDAAAVSEPNQTKPNIPQWTHPRSDVRIEERRQMVEVLKRRYEMTNQKILQAMLDVPRHWFVPAGQQSGAYADSPLPIGHGQTISQPFIVAYMTQLLELTPESKVLEIGTGSGYQAAVLSELTPHVFSIEIVEPLGKRAVETFAKRSYSTIRAKIGDGYKGWPEHAKFDAVIVTCAPDHIPQPLVDQLKADGKIVIPVGRTWGIQDLLLVTKNTDGKLERKSMMPVRFVPLVRDRE